MNNNIISKSLKVIGIATIVIGAVASLIVGAVAENASIIIVGIIGSIISGLLFLGFSEAINLLQQNIDNQKMIIEKLGEKPSTVVKEIAPTKNVSELQDIEANLPQI